MNDITLIRTGNSLFFKKVSSKSGVSKTDDCDGYLVRSSESETRRIIDSLKGSGKTIAFVGGDNALNRRALETLKIDFLVSPEQGEKRGSLKQRDSGLNHVLAKIAAKKGIPLIIDMSEVSKLREVFQAERLERLIQNVSLCKKAGCSLKIASFATSKKNLLDEFSRRSFGMSLGMSSQQAHDCVVF